MGGTLMDSFCNSESELCDYRRLDYSDSEWELGWLFIVKLKTVIPKLKLIKEANNNSKFAYFDN